MQQYRVALILYENQLRTGRFKKKTKDNVLIQCAALS